MSVGRNDSSHTVYRGQHLTYTLQCSFNRRVNVTTSSASGVGGERVDAGVNVTEKETFYEKKGETNFTAEMVFHTNNLYDAEAASPLQVISVPLLSRR